MTDRGEVRGDGRLDTNPLTRFVFHNVKSDGTSPASGQISFTDRAADPRLDFESTAITTLVIAGTHVKLTGTGTANGLPTDFVVEGDDGSPDRFSIGLSNGYFSSRRGRLRAGGEPQAAARLSPKQSERPAHVGFSLTASLNAGVGIQARGGSRSQ